jgi:solute carrier family 25 protein 16
MTTTAAQTNSASNIIPDHDVAMDAKKEGNTQSPGTKRTDKKSPEYLIKSGLAGGFAGCAVRHGHAL